MKDLPDYYFRIRENGAAVFRVSTENRHQRVEMNEIAFVNVKNGNIRPHGDHVLTAEETTAIEAWTTQRRALLAARDLDGIHRTVDQMNLAAHWAQSRASEADLDEVTDPLLLAMHDLRTVLVRKKADRLAAATAQSGE